MNDRIVCQYCNREFSKYGIKTHIWRVHGDGQNFDSNQCYKNGTKQVWIKGKTKQNNNILAEASKKISKALKENSGHKQSEETKHKISNYMKTAHKDGKAFNIKNSGYSYASKISQELFWNVYNRLPKNLQDEVKFSSLNREKFFKMENKNIALDFYISSLKLCIEFNGDMWHGNPEIYKESDYPLKNIKSKSYLSAKDIWDNDKKRIDFLKQKGINIIVVWEKEYLKDKEKIVEYLINKIIK